MRWSYNSVLLRILGAKADNIHNVAGIGKVGELSHRRVLFALGFTLTATPCLCLIGWWTGSPFLKAVIPGLTPMNPVVAICFILVTTALFTLRTSPVARFRSAGLALIVVSAALCRLVATMLGQDKTIDTLLFAQRLEAELRPNRMATTTAWSLLAAGLTVLILAGTWRKRIALAQLCALAAAITGIVVVNCYAAAVLAGQVPGTDVPMALSVAVLCIAFCASTLLLTAREGLAAVLMEDTHGALFARRLMASLLIVPPVLAWLTHRGEVMGFYGKNNQDALLVTLLAVGFGVNVWLGARKLSAMERHARTVEQELRASKELLERRVDERTADLTNANESLRAEIEQRQSLHEQLVQSQKMESLGSLAGGIAHDFNNLLTGMLGYAELAQLRLPADSPVQGDLDEIRQSAERAAALTKQLLTFARKEVVEPQVVDLNELAGGLAKLIRRLLGEDIELTTFFGEGLGRVQIDPSQFEQVIVNLAVNARDAMPHGGKLVIETSNMELDEPQVAHRAVMVPGDYVVFSVSDSGSGISKEVQAQVFDPFFTTKEKGKGTGLGLSTCYGIIRNSGGYIWVYSELGIGTTFRIYLPRVDDVPVASAAENEDPLGHGGETVLVVEDEESVRAIATKSLRQAGYTVLEAVNGRNALGVLAQYDSAVDLVVTDVIMPEMNGRELAEALKLVRPEAKVLYTSGYTDDSMVLQGVLSHRLAFLQKPFTPRKLAQKVREVLDQPKAA